MTVSETGVFKPFQEVRYALKVFLFQRIETVWVRKSYPRTKTKAYSLKGVFFLEEPETKGLHPS